MSTTTDIQIRILVTGVEDVSISLAIPSEGVNNGSVAIPAGEKRRIPLADIPVEDMRVLVIESSVYQDITYSVLDGLGELYELDNVAMFMGIGMLSLFDTVPTQLWVYNDGLTEVTISTIFIFDSVEESSSSSVSSESSVSSDSSTSSQSSTSIP